MEKHDQADSKHCFLKEQNKIVTSDVLAVLLKPGELLKACQQCQAELEVEQQIVLHEV